MILLALALAEEPRGEVVSIEYRSDRVISRVLPEFPPEAVAQGVRVGGCEVRVYMDEEGVPYNAVPVQCDEVWVAASTGSALQWRFHPHTVDGVARKAKFNLLFVYEYQGKPAAPPAP